MKYYGGKSHFNPITKEWESRPRIYTDFYCSLKEWATLGRGKENFMYQVRSAIVERFGYPSGAEYEDKDDEVWSSGETKIKLKNGLVLNKLSFDRHGRRDSLVGERYSASIVRHAIKLITHRDAEVEFYSWKGLVDHIEITFPHCAMPNLIVLIDEYTGSTNRELIACIDAIYNTLHAKTTEYYDKSLYLYYNDNYDLLCYASKEDASKAYIDYANVWMWSDRFRHRADRIYDNCTINYIHDYMQV